MTSIRSAVKGNTGPAEAAGFLIRLAAMTYESVLLFGVVFVAGYGVLSIARWTYPLSAPQRLVLQCALFVVIGAYFVYQWTRTGQTLAMKSWNLRLVDASGRPPSARTALLRYVLAWHLFLPGIAWTALFGGGVGLDLLAFALGFLALLVPVMASPPRPLLHERLTATRVVRER